MSCFPKLIPYQEVENYRASVNECQKPAKLPDQDLARDSPDVHLIAAQNELVIAENDLEERRKWFKEKKEVLDEYWEQLRKDEEEFHKNFIHMNKFVKDNIDKRIRASNKQKEDLILVEKRSQEIKDLQNKYEYCHETKVQMEEMVKKYKIYLDFLSNVQASSSEFQSVDEIIKKYETYTDTKLLLTWRQEDALQALEIAQSQMTKLVEKSTLKIIILQTRHADLITRYEDAKAKNSKWEAVVSKIREKCAQNLHDIQLVKDTIWKTYQQMCKRKNFPLSVGKDNLAGQLSFIKSTIKQLEVLHETAKKSLQDPPKTKVETKKTVIKSKIITVKQKYTITTKKIKSGPATKKPSSSLNI